MANRFSENDVAREVHKAISVGSNIIEEVDVTDDVLLLDAVGLDMGNIVVVVIELEDRFGINITQEECESIFCNDASAKVKDVIDFVVKKLAD